MSQHNDPKPKSDWSQADATLAKLAQAKKLSIQFLESLGLRDDPVRGVCIPYYDKENNHVLDRFRRLMNSSTQGARFFQAKGSKTTLYGLWRLDPTATRVLLVEGESDCWTAWAHPIENLQVLGIPGSKGAKKEYAELLQGFEEIMVWDERDSGSVSFIAGCAKHLGKITVVSHDEFKDLSDIHLSDRDFVETLAGCLEYGRPVFASSPERPVITFKTTKGLLGLVAHSTAADRLSPVIAKQLRFETVTEDWYKADQGTWHRVNPGVAVAHILSAIEKSIGPHGPGFSVNYLHGITQLLRYKTSVEANDDLESLPFDNGVLDLNSRLFRSFQQKDFFTWRLPFAYDSAAQCPNTIAFLKECVGGDEGQVELLRAFLYAVLTGRYEWHRLLELIGTGGTGKGTFINLAIAMVGENNAHITELKRLEKSRFETSKLYDKRLCVITDAESFSGDVSMLKAMTGGDRIPYEEKNKPIGQHFHFKGLVIIAANEDVKSRDYTGGLSRRRLVVPFNNFVPPENRRDVIAELTPEIPGLINWVLDIGEARARALVVRTEELVETLGASKRAALIRTNPIAAWLDENVAYTGNPADRVFVGRKEFGEFDAIINNRTHLFPNYCQWCEETNNKEMALNRFSENLHDLLVYQLRLPKVERLKVKKGSCFTGIRLGEGISPLSGVKKPHQVGTQTQKNTEECGGDVGLTNGDVGVTYHKPPSDYSDVSINNNYYNKKEDIGNVRLYKKEKKHTSPTSPQSPRGFDASPIRHPSVTGDVPKKNGKGLHKPCAGCIHYQEAVLCKADQSIDWAKKSGQCRRAKYKK